VAHSNDDSWREVNLAGGTAGEERRPQRPQQWKAQEVDRHVERGAEDGRRRRLVDASAKCGADRWAEEQLFEEDVRAVLMLMRPNRRERMQGWSEYRTGGAHFRATVSWDEHFADTDAGAGKMRIPNMCDVLEAILVGSARHDDDLMPAEEFEIYRGVVRELYRRLDELQACYE